MPVMPDTRIFGGDDGGGVMDSPLKTLGAMMQIKEQQQAYQARQQDAMLKAREVQDDNETRQALLQFGRPEEAIDHLWKTGRSNAAAKLSKDVMGERTARWQAADTELKVNGDRLGQAAQLLGSVTDDASYQTIRPQVAKIVEPLYGKAINDQLPTNYDPDKIKQLIMAGTSRAEQIQQQRDLGAKWRDLYTRGMTSFSEYAKHDPDMAGQTPDRRISEWSAEALKSQADQQDMLVQQLQSAPNQGAWDQILKTADDNGASRVVTEKFAGRWQPDPTKRQEYLRSQGMSMREQAAAEVQARNSDTAALRVENQQYRDENTYWRNQEKDRLRDEKAAAAIEKAKHPTLTPAGKVAETRRIDRDIAATEKYVKDAFGQSKEAESGEWSGDYQRLSPELKQEYIERRVKHENDSRTRVQGLPSLEEAAQKAVDENDQPSYEKLDTVYRKITQGLGSIEDVVEWPDRDVGAKTPAAQARRAKRLKPILERLKDPKLSPADRAALEQERNDILR